MIDHKMARLALDTILSAFGSKSDRLGNWAVLHSLRVGAAGRSLDEIVVGLLHDVVEDTEVTIKDLEKVFPPHIIEAVFVLTRKPGITYKDFIRDIVALGGVAQRVKRADVLDNLARVHELPYAKERARLMDRYQWALTVLR